MKRFIFFLVSISVALLFTGCFTMQLWQDKSAFRETKLSYYDDIITAFMMTEEGSKIIFVSEKYHYILESDPKLVYLLQHKDELPVQYDFDHGHYTIDIDNNVSAIFGASLDRASLNQQIKEVLETYHLSVTSKNKLIFTFTLQGTRYLADPKVNDKIIPLRHPIPLHFSETIPTALIKQKVKKIALSPFTLAADGAFAIIGAFAIGTAAIEAVVLSPFMLVKYIIQHN